MIKIFEFKGKELRETLNNPNMSRASEYVTFQSLEYLRDDEVFCVTVNSDDMKWVCNGIVTHNTEFNYDPDVQDIRVNLQPHEAQAVFRTMLAISQIENKVKKFWHNLGNHIPKPEFEDIAATFSESEARHKDAYAHLLEKLGLNQEFENLTSVPAIKDRMTYMDKVNQKIALSNDPRNYFEAIILFAILIENISLFSQFYIIMSFDKFNKQLKGMANAVEATSKEEDIHARFGFELINIIKQEHPDWWDEALQARVYQIAEKAVNAEVKVLDWIYENGDLETAPREVVIEFIKILQLKRSNSKNISKFNIDISM
jgi:ribonucleoside-diphosphate reductase beta chain